MVLSTAVLLVFLVAVSVIELCSSPAVSYILITEDLHFYHFSRENPINGTELKVGEILNSNINTTFPWKFFIHGWTTSPDTSPWYWTGKTAYLDRGEYNIIFVDWSKPANQSYKDSICNTYPSGVYLGKFIATLTENNVSLNNIHLIGHSLGSHMAGAAGSYISKKFDKKVGRISALDAAGPLFETPEILPEECRFRLSSNDSDFVDVTHTDAGHYGMTESIGHIDFFPNGGVPPQPGCQNSTNENCSHAKSTKYFVESINSRNFIARECVSYEDYQNGICCNNTKAIFGEDVDRDLRGNFYFSTNPEPPYAKGE